MKTETYIVMDIESDGPIPGEYSMLSLAAVAAPAGSDLTFVYWYLMKFVGHSVFSFSCMAMKTLAMSLLRLPYKQSTKRNYPSHWFNPQLKHTHHALMDAQEQAYTFAEMLKELHSHV